METAYGDEERQGDVGEKENREKGRENTEKEGCGDRGGEDVEEE